MEPTLKSSLSPPYLKSPHKQNPVTTPLLLRESSTGKASRCVCKGGADQIFLSRPSARLPRLVAAHAPRLPWGSMIWVTPEVAETTIQRPFSPAREGFFGVCKTFAKELSAY